MNLNEAQAQAQAQEDDGVRKPSNPKDLTAMAEKRIDFSLIPLAGQIEEALAFLEGHYKYGGHNYIISQVAATTYINAAMRHLLKYLHGEERDPVTGVHHLGSLRACCNVILSAVEGGYLIDDRPPTPRNMSKIFGDYSPRAEYLFKTYGPGPGRWTETRRRKLVQAWHQLQKDKQEKGLKSNENTSSPTQPNPCSTDSPGTSPHDP